MTIGLIGKKCGMTRIFSELGESIPIVVIEVLPNRITQVKSQDTDGYYAIQVTVGEQRASRMTKPLLGHYAKANVSPGIGLWEFRLNVEDLDKEALTIGDELTVELFREGQLVDVRGVTKGKGFAGVIKRYHFSRQGMSHGNSLSHRAPGSIGQRQTPGRVFKGKKMAGHLGCKVRTIKNQEIIKVDKSKNLLMVKGVVPGASGSKVIILPVSKRYSKGE